VIVQPDTPGTPDGLSPAALDVLHELESFARLNPDAPATALVWHLARKWIPGWLKKPRKAVMAAMEKWDAG
jgi:hypothetical protein